VDEPAGLTDWVAPLGSLDGSYSVGTLGIERTAKYLRWRYVRHPQPAQFRLFLVRDAQGIAQGAAIVSRNQRPDRRQAVVEELIAPVIRPDMVKALLCAALRWAADAELENLMTMPGRSAFRPLYWELGFETKARSAPAAVVPRGIADPASVERSFEIWHGAMF
jgi:hypothetical protein